MYKNLRNVDRKGAEFATCLLTVETAEEMEAGLLFGLNEDGKAILADSEEGVHAIGVVFKTSTEEWGAKTVLNGEAILREGERIDVFTHFVVYAEECVGGVVGANVYLGKKGKLTFEPSIQLVGVLGNSEAGAVRVALGGIDA